MISIIEFSSLLRVAYTPERPRRTDPMSAEFYHEPVLMDAVLAAFAPAENRLIVDGTLGGGGHSEALLRAGAQVIGIDQDAEAVAYASKRLAPFGSNFRAVQANYSEIPDVLASLGVEKIDGALLDLGVSSHQLDEPSRGFSFMHDGPLDMRMNPEAGPSAADLVNTLDDTALVQIFRELGEESAARKIASAIVQRRRTQPFSTTLDLARCIESVHPRRGRTHPATKVFQALRMEVNRELDVLESALPAISSLLAPDGRFAVITFHSLEDRIVKHFFKKHSAPEIDRPEWPAARPNPEYWFDLLSNKPAIAGEAELERNPRSRSAKLRAVRAITTNTR